MKAIQIIPLVLAAGFTANILAAPAPKPPPGPTDVNVVNTPTVTVANPQATVTVDNGLGNPVPVSGAVTIENLTPIPVSVQNQVSGCAGSQFVGFTVATFQGNKGVATYTGSCQIEYAGSHMCNSTEYLNSPSYPITTGIGWLKPTLIANEVDISGAAPAISGGSLSCSGWFFDSGSGLTVDQNGSFFGRPCSQTHSVACCVSTQ